ncbi:hypothetical protein QFC21_001179 [Naganishia friedmannii]|uniref:Uncharacterized protein n=1 Tax=Naganishia friedmannii TaxID=89922 RepID=A0ACC2W931_9TREE|nr:hypothetical protein QFC21_001179 [Naganishia friedmannii]
MCPSSGDTESAKPFTTPSPSSIRFDNFKYIQSEGDHLQLPFHGNVTSCELNTSTARLNIPSDVSLDLDNCAHELFYDDDSETKTERHYSRPHTPPPRHSDHLPPTQHYPPEIELHLEPMTPYIAPPIPASSPEIHSTMLSHRFLPLPLPQGFQANNVRSHGNAASPPEVQLHDFEIKEPRRYQSRDVPELPQIMEVARERHADQGSYSPTAPGSALPLLTPAMPRAEQTMRYDQQHRPSRSDPEFTRQPLGPPVSFARSYSTPTDSSFPAEASGSLRQFASPTSKRNLFNSAAVYNSWIGSLHPTPMHHRRYSQQLNHRVGDLLPYRRPVHDRHLVEQQEPLGHVVDYGPSSSASGRRSSYHQTMQRENVPRYADSPPPRTYHTTTPQKVKVRRKQGPSVKKTEKDSLFWRSSEMQQLRAAQQNFMRIHARVRRRK